jgi:hypothetical protein
LFVIDAKIPAKVLNVSSERGLNTHQQCIIEIAQSLFEFTQEEIRDAFLKVCNREKLVQLCGFDVHFGLPSVDDSSASTYRFLVLSYRRLDHSHIEEDLGRVGDFLRMSNHPIRESLYRERP